MSCQFCLALALPLIFLSACGGAEPSQKATDEYIQIVEAVLQSQPDEAKAHREFIADYPDEKSVLDSVLDHRLCVSRETAGEPGDFDRTDTNPDQAPHSSGFYGNRWEQSPARQVIPEQLLPEHLRWDSFIALCPRGVLRIGNPEIEGDEASVFVENRCSGWCGWGGQVILKRVDGRWSFNQMVGWWYS